jgi:hypothetical protein
MTSVFTYGGAEFRLREGEVGLIGATILVARMRGLPTGEMPEVKALHAAQRDLITALAQGDLVGEWVRLTAPYEMGPPLGERTRLDSAAFASYRPGDEHGSVASVTPGVPPEWAVSTRDDSRFLLALREDVVKAWARGQSDPKTTSPTAQRIAGTIAAERRLQAYLESLMLADAKNSPGKEAVREMAKDAGHVVGTRAFARAFAAAVQKTGAVDWSGPGRKPKRRIETAD